MDVDQMPKLYIRGQISPKGGMFDMFGGEVFSASDVVKFLQDHKDDQNIAVEISSDGGYKSEGVEIYHLLKNSGKTITTVIYKAN
jgi:ATP-dependent protease ClpP protease subunit